MNLTKNLNLLAKGVLSVVGVAAASGMALTVAPQAQAAIIFSNTGTVGQVIGTETMPNQQYTITGVNRQAISFTTPNDGLIHTLQDISVGLLNVGSLNQTLNIDFFPTTTSGTPPAPTGTPTTIFSQSISVPFQAAANAYIFTTSVASQNIQLQPNTTYALSFYGTSGGSLSVWGNCPQGGACVGAPGYTGLGTVRRNFITSATNVWTSESAERLYQVTFSDTGVSVPEPTTILGLLAFGGAGLLTKRNKKDLD